MVKDTILILERDDLISDYKKKDFYDINHRDFPLEMIQKITAHGVCLFVDRNGRTKILKNKYGDEGERFDFNKLMDKYELTSERYIEAEKFLAELSELNTWEKLSLAKRIGEYLKSVLIKYKF